MKKLPFLPRLEALRGVAALSVVGYHAESDQVVTGMAPVVLFFVLSGFVLARSLEINGSAFVYARRRVLRLIPAAAATVFLLTALYWRFGITVGPAPSLEPLKILSNALLIRSDINGVAWSLTVECVAAPLIFAAFYTYRSRGPLPLILLVVLLFALSFYGPYVHLLGGVTNLAPLYAFIIGVLFNFALQRPGPTAILAVSAICIAMLIFCGLRKQTTVVMLLESVSAGGLIFLIATSPAALIFSPLDWKPVRLLGQISYSFYLLHPIGIVLADMTFSAPSPLMLFLPRSRIQCQLRYFGGESLRNPSLARGAPLQCSPNLKGRSPQSNQAHLQNPDDIVAKDCRLHIRMRPSIALTVNGSCDDC
jgi:peptidoglycan/LPS O-acetylase OafA/YrhL